MSGDAGLASDYWRGYYSAEEVDEILAAACTTTIVSGRMPLHVRMFRQESDTAPTVVMGHGMLVYGLALARLQLPFHRAGFNVVQFDLPGMGQSGGTRAGCTIADVILAWEDTLAFAVKEFGGPVFVLGVAEDGVAGYYAAANRPDVAALSVHTLFEYGDHGGVAWLGPVWKVRLTALALGLGARLAPRLRRPAASGVPYDQVFGGPGDDVFVSRLRADPLGLQDVELRFSHSLVKRRPPPVAFEDCETPVQVIASDANTIWPFDVVRRGWARLGGPKDLVVLEGRPQWESNREFHETYCGHVIRWFVANGAEIRGRT